MLARPLAAAPLLASALLAAAQPDRDAPTTSTSRPPVPRSVLDAWDRMLIAAPTSRPATPDARRKRVRAYLRRGEKILAQYAHAPNLHEVHLRALQAYTWLARQGRDKYDLDRMVAAARKILDAPSAPPRARVEADRVVTIEKLDRLRAADTAEADRLVRAFAGRYERTPAAATAAVYAAMMAAHVGRNELRDAYLDLLEQRYLDRPGVVRYLVHAGRRPVFRAALSRLDGTTLRLTRDLAGKVVLLVFWSAESKGCAEHIDEWQRLYRKHEAAGLRIVTVSLDTDRRKFKQFAQSEAPRWIHTFSGRGRSDPTAVRCTVRRAPTVWLLDRRGKVVATDVGRNLDALVERVLAGGAGRGKRQ